MSLTLQEVEEVAERAAKRAVAEMLLTLGVNTANADAILEMQKDFAAVRAWRQSVETVRTRGLIAAASFIVAGVLGALWLGFKDMVH